MVTRFEAAADAIISGDITTLKKLLQENPALIRQRSTREHRATLLHYASANGVEGYRQKTPQNIVEIAELLLKSGAEVDAEADAVADHHAYLDAVGSNFVRELRPEAFIIPSWYVSHPIQQPYRCAGCSAVSFMREIVMSMRPVLWKKTESSTTSSFRK